MTRIKKQCERCGQEYNNLHKFKGYYLCIKCYNKQVHIISPLGENNPHKPLSMEKALAKEYLINESIQSSGSKIGFRSFPSVLAGHKVKLILVD